MKRERNPLHKSFKIRHTANTSTSAHKLVSLGFNITQLLTEVTNLEMTRCCTKMQDITAKKICQFGSALHCTALHFTALH